MVRFANETTIVGDGPSHCNDDFDDTESKHLNNSITVRKKRLPSTPHPASLDGIKKRSPSNDRGNDRNNVDEQANMCIASQDVDAVRRGYTIAFLVGSRYHDSTIVCSRPRTP